MTACRALLLSAVCWALVACGSSAPAASAEPAAIDRFLLQTFLDVCVANKHSVDRGVDLAKKAGFERVSTPTPEGVDEVALLRTFHNNHTWTVALGRMRLPAMDGYPPQSSLSCAVTGNKAAVSAKPVEDWVGIAPYAREPETKLFAFEMSDGRPKAIDARDRALVSALLKGDGHYLLILKEAENGTVVASLTRGIAPGKDRQ